MEKYLMSYEEFNRLINEYDYENDCAVLEQWERFDKGDAELPTYLLIDTVESYKEFGNQKFIIIQNNYEDDHFDWQKGLDVLLMTISDNPQLYLSDAIVNLKEEDIEKIRQFVIKYKEKLEELADQTWIDKGTSSYWKWYEDFHKPKNKQL